ncbi:MAG: hypothetical protein IJP07_06230 [Firmicutes bacterium]|nr:hypothetical protein [Bacillota bacterium]
MYQRHHGADHWVCGEPCFPRRDWLPFWWAFSPCWADPRMWQALFCSAIPQRQPRREPGRSPGVQPREMPCPAYPCPTSPGRNCPGEDCPAYPCPTSPGRSCPGKDCPSYPCPGANALGQQGCGEDPGQKKLELELCLPPCSCTRQVRAEVAELQWISPACIEVKLWLCVEYHDQRCRIHRKEYCVSRQFPWYQRCQPQASLIGQPRFRQEGDRLLLSLCLALSC